MKNKLCQHWLLQRFAFTCLTGLLLVTLTGCQIFASKISREYQDGIPSSAHLAMLPFINHTTVSDEEAVQLKRMLSVQLAVVGITNTFIYQKPEAKPVPSYLSDIYEQEQAQLWAKSKKINLSISGEILDWQYDEQNRFSTELQLKVIHIASGEVIWSTNGFAEGRQGESAYDVSRRLIADLVAAMPVHRAK